MNIVDYIIIVILLLGMIKGFKDGLLPSIVNFVGTFLIFIIAFFLKQPVSSLLYENLPFISFGGIFKGIIGINILFYEALAYGLTITILGIIFGIIKKVSKGLQRLLNSTLLLSIPSKIIGAIIGILEGVLYVFLLLHIGSVINVTASYINNSKYSSIILDKTPIINNVTNEFREGAEEIYNTVMNNKDDVNKANLNTIDILMNKKILSYESAKKLVDNKKINIDGINEIIEKYRR